MKLQYRVFGMSSGVYTTFGLLPHIIFLVMILDSSISIESAVPFVIFTIGAKILGEWYFWRYFKKRMDGEKVLKNWREIVNRSLFSHSNVASSLFMYFADAFTDGILIYIALKMSISPILVLLVLLGCQALASPVQGFLSDFFSKKDCLLFASTMGVLAAVIALGIFFDRNAQGESTNAIGNLFGATSLTPTMQIFLVLCGKGLFANLTVIARSAIAEVIKMKTLAESPDW